MHVNNDHDLTFRLSSLTISFETLYKMAKSLNSRSITDCDIIILNIF